MNERKSERKIIIFVVFSGISMSYYLFYFSSFDSHCCVCMCVRSPREKKRKTSSKNFKVPHTRRCDNSFLNMCVYGCLQVYTNTYCLFFVLFDHERKSIQHWNCMCARALCRKKRMCVCIFLYVLSFQNQAFYTFLQRSRSFPATIASRREPEHETILFSFFNIPNHWFW